jgi:predicted amino acid-binding ACT domain protein
MGTASHSRYVISVLIADRVGILRDMTTAVTDMGANIDGITQTVVEGYFTGILTATFFQPRSVEDVRAAVREKFAGDECSIVVVPYSARRHARPPVRGDRYVVTITGRDRPGILKAVTSFLADRGINIEDWQVAFERPDVTHIGEVTLPRRLDLKQIQDELRQILNAMGLTSCIQHENIFRVTSEVGAVEMFLEEKRHAEKE